MITFKLINNEWLDYLREFGK